MTGWDPSLFVFSLPQKSPNVESIQLYGVHFLLHIFSLWIFLRPSATPFVLIPSAFTEETSIVFRVKASPASAAAGKEIGNHFPVLFPYWTGKQCWFRGENEEKTDAKEKLTRRGLRNTSKYRMTQRRRVHWFACKSLGPSVPYFVNFSIHESKVTTCTCTTPSICVVDK